MNVTKCYYSRMSNVELFCNLELDKNPLEIIKCHNNKFQYLELFDISNFFPVQFEFWHNEILLSMVIYFSINKICIAELIFAE